MAGSGGQMSTRKREPRKQAPREAANTQVKKRAKQASEHPGERPDTETEANEDGFESMRSAADRQLGQNSRQIAEAFGKKAADGDLNSAKFLVAVAVAEKKASKTTRKKRHGPTEAQRLALEPQWVPPQTDAKPNPDDEEPSN